MTLRRFNNGLTVVVVVLGLYIAAVPFLPEFFYWFRDRSPEVVAPYAGALASLEGSSSTDGTPQENRLVIPSIGLNEEILESSNIGVINDGGTWRRPNAAIPTDNDNAVIVGHRFYGNNVSTFYHLDKVEVGETFAVYWEGEELLYNVTEKKVVPADATEIEGSTDSRQLTLYTCDPVWTAENRLVIVATPIEGGEDA